MTPANTMSILALSVLHHMCHEQGLAAVQALLASLADRTEVILAETALREEPLYWAAAQAGDPRQLFAGHAFVHAVEHHPTHLSGVARPFLFASNRWWYLGGELARFDRWTDVSHQAAGGVHAGTRRYYFAADRLAKHFLLTGQPGARNREELEREAAFLDHPPAGLRTPALYAKGVAETEGWLVRELLPGRLVSEFIAAGEPFDRAAVIGDVLDDLCALEAAHLYHGDVRTWNLILGTDGRARLIDYGDITSSPRDCAWPDNLFLSFLVFVHELESRELLGALPIRTPAFAPQHFTPELRGWVAALWRRPVDDWTFVFLRDEFRARNVTQDVSAIGRSDAGPAWQAAVERYLEVLSDRQRTLVASLERQAAELSNREAVIFRLSTALDEEKKTSGRLAAAAETLRAAHAGAKDTALKLQEELVRHARVGASLGGDPAAAGKRGRDVVEQRASPRVSTAALQRNSKPTAGARAPTRRNGPLVDSHRLTSSASSRVLFKLVVEDHGSASHRQALACRLWPHSLGTAVAKRTGWRRVGGAVRAATSAAQGLDRCAAGSLSARHCTTQARGPTAGGRIGVRSYARRDHAKSDALGRDGAELLSQLEREIGHQKVDLAPPS